MLFRITCDKTAVMVATPRLSMLFRITCDKTAVMVATPRALLNCSRTHTARSHTRSSSCPHWYICSLTKFIFGIHPRVRISICSICSILWIVLIEYKSVWKKISSFTARKIHQTNLTSAPREFWNFSVVFEPNSKSHLSAAWCLLYYIQADNS